MAAPPSGGNDFANTGPCYGLPRTRLTPVASTEPRRYSTATSSSYQLPARISLGGAAIRGGLVCGGRARLGGHAFSV